jgi:hypothetical protein
MVGMRKRWEDRTLIGSGYGDEGTMYSLFGASLKRCVALKHSTEAACMRAWHC